MFMRTFKGNILITLAGVLVVGCQRASPDDARAGDGIDCAVNGSDFANDCTVESEAGNLTIHHPGGGFRRFVIERQGAITAADGADTVNTKSLPDGRMEIEVGRDRYVIGQASSQAKPR
jgi:hypothetical protein